MPIYEYQCKSCCHCFEKLVLSIVEPPPKCPQCACKDVIKLMSAATVRSHRAFPPVQAVSRNRPASPPVDRSSVFPRFEEKIQSAPGVVDRPICLFEMPMKSMPAQYRRLDYIRIELDNRTPFNGLEGLEVIQIVFKIIFHLVTDTSQK